MTGSLQIKNEKYYAVLHMGDGRYKWIGTKLDTKGNNKRKAEKILRDLITEYEQKLPELECDMDFVKYISQWIECIKVSVELSTYEGYSLDLKNHIIPYFDKHKINLLELKPFHLQQYYNEMLKNGKKNKKGGLSAKTIKNHHSVIRKALQDAIKNDLIHSNPADRVTLPKRQKFIGQFYTLEQVNKLIETSKGTEMYLAVLLAVYTGCRRSELLGFKWDSVNWEYKTITVKDTVVRINTLIQKKGTKTKSSYRTLQLTDEIMNILSDEYQKQQEFKKLFGNQYHKNEYIIRQPDGTSYVPNTFTAKIQNKMKKSGLPILRLHDLRHTTASLLLSLGLSMKEIQEWLGHSDMSTTANIYAHIDTQSKKRLAERLGNSLAF